MQKHHVTHYQTKIDCSVEKVWDALTRPEIVKQYFFGSQLITSWEPGTSIAFKGEWDGQEYCDKGEVLEYTPYKKLAFSYLSSWSNKEDLPENYLYVSYEVWPEGNQTNLTISQSNYSVEQADHSRENWAQVVDAMRKIIE